MSTMAGLGPATVHPAKATRVQSGPASWSHVPLRMPAWSIFKWPRRIWPAYLQLCRLVQIHGSDASVRPPKLHLLLEEAGGRHGREAVDGLGDPADDGVGCRRDVEPTEVEHQEHVHVLPLATALSADKALCTVDDLAQQTRASSVPPRSRMHIGSDHGQCRPDYVDRPSSSSFGLLLFGEGAPWPSD